MMHNVILAVISLLLTSALSVQAVNAAEPTKGKFITIDGTSLVGENGKPYYIVGTNLGNWLNPEGYMFGFKKTNCEWMINEMVCEMTGPDAAREFWQKFKDDYITEDDIAFISKCGANTIRLPFNYKLFTAEDYMGMNDPQEGFRLMDKVIGWAKKYGLHVILYMHDCPGGQTGDNIDNGYGYPWLFVSEASQKQFIDIWTKIATHFAGEPAVLGYELMNEPIATTFTKEVQEELNKKLEPLYKKAVAAIRTVDKNHIILLGGSQWNSNFEPFTDWKFDNKIMYTCHRYGGDATKEAIGSFIAFRDKTGLPMYMGELGHNTDKWQSDFVKVLREANIGYTFWPYKKIESSCMVGIAKPEEWDSTVVKFSEADRNSFDAIRKARPDQATAYKLLMQFAENSKFQNCNPQPAYISSIGLSFGF